MSGSTEALLRPYGPTATLELLRGTEIPEIRYRGRPGYSLSHELLEISEEGLLVLAKEKVILVEYKAIKAYKYDNKGPVVDKKDTPEEIKAKIMNTDKGKLSLQVRFPQGTSPEVLNALLSAYDQESLIIVKGE